MYLVFLYKEPRDIEHYVAYTITAITRLSTCQEQFPNAFRFFLHDHVPVALVDQQPVKTITT